MHAFLSFSVLRGLHNCCVLVLSVIFQMFSGLHRELQCPIELTYISYPPPYNCLSQYFHLRKKDLSLHHPPLPGNNASERGQLWYNESHGAEGGGGGGDETALGREGHRSALSTSLRFQPHA